MVTDNGMTGKAERITPTVTSPLTERKTVTSPLTERRKERTRCDIVRAAGELFRERGWDATTIEDIAAAAEIGTRTFYRYFATKEDVIIDQAVSGLERMADNLAHQPESMAVRDALKLAVHDTVVAMVEPSPPAVRLTRSEGALRARLLDRLMQAQEVLIPGVADRLGEAQGSLRTQLTVAGLSMAVQVAITEWAHDPDARPLIDIVDDAVDMILDGLVSA
jgi:AcrR family transcriptional regulator